MRGSVLRRSFRVRGCAQAIGRRDFADARVCGGRLFDDRCSGSRWAEGTLRCSEGEAPRAETRPRAGTGAGSTGAWARGTRRGVSFSPAFARQDATAGSRTGPGSGSTSSCSPATSRPGAGGNRRNTTRRSPTTTTTGTTTSAATTSTTTTHDNDRHDDHHANGGETYEQAISYTQNAAVVHAQPYHRREQRLSAAGGPLEPAAGRSRPGDGKLHGQRYDGDQEPALIPGRARPQWCQLRLLRRPEQPGRLVNNAANLYIFGGDMPAPPTPAAKASSSTGRQHVLWWGFTIHDTGSTGFAARAINGPVDHDDFQGTIWKIGQNLAWDHALRERVRHRPPRRQPLGRRHGRQLHEQPVRVLRPRHSRPAPASSSATTNPTSQATGNILYLKCVNETEVALRQTGGNGLQLWGDTDTLGVDVKYLEVDSAQGRALDNQGVSPQASHSPASPSTTDTASNTNQNSQLNEPNNRPAVGLGEATSTTRTSHRALSRRSPDDPRAPRRAGAHPG